MTGVKHIMKRLNSMMLEEFTNLTAIRQFGNFTHMVWTGSQNVVYGALCDRLLSIDDGGPKEYHTDQHQCSNTSTLLHRGPLQVTLMVTTSITVDIDVYILRKRGVLGKADKPAAI